MNTNVERMLNELSPVIDQKCEELRAARKERLLSKVFILLCVMVVLIPTLLVFAGVSLTALIALPVFMALNAILLLPVLLSDKTSNQGGIGYEQA